MDDIDKELKKVQLARERLALERELGRRDLKASTLGAAKGAIGLAGTGISLARGAARASWKVVGFLIVVSAGVYGVSEWVKAVDAAESDARRAKYQSELREFVILKCGPYRVVDDDYNWCRYQATKAFEETPSK